jgi:hypothetical protein
MIDPTFLPFLTEAIARTGVHRYRYLCLEHPDQPTREGYQRIVIEIASGTYAGQRFDPDAQQPPSVPCCS